MKISVIHPSRNRPERASKVYNQMITKADKPELIEYIISIDNDETKDYTNIRSGIFSPITLVSDNRFCVGAINNGAKASTGKILMVASDDFDEFTVSRFVDNNTYIGLLLADFDVISTGSAKADN